MKIVDIEGKEWEYGDCVSCAISQKLIQPFGGIIFETKYFLVTQDFSRPINGFIVVASKRHIVTYDALSGEEQIELSKLISCIESILKKAKICDYFNIYVAEYKEGHFHLQILPRYKWMEDERGTIIGNLNRGFQYAKNHLNTAENLKQIKKTISILKKELKKVEF